MAIYHLQAKVIGRSSGRSATGAAAYRAGERIEDRRTGQVFDYSQRRGIEHREIVAPDNAPEWMRDRVELWNAVEKVEARKDAQLAREVEVALPRELSKEQRLDTVRQFIRDEFVSRGMVVDFAIHYPKTKDGLGQPHAHIMLTMRDLTGTGFGPKNREWNGKDLLEGWRERWADHANRALERAGREERIDHRSLADQRAEALRIAADPARSEPEREVAAVRADALDREPLPKLGAAARMEKRGVETERGAQWRRVQELNAERSRLRRALAEVRDQAARFIGRSAEVLRQGADAAKARFDALLGRRQGVAEPMRPPVDRDALVGRQPPQVVHQPQTVDRDALLGRTPPEGRPQSIPDRDALLGRDPVADWPMPDRDRDDGRGG